MALRLVFFLILLAPILPAQSLPVDLLDRKLRNDIQAIDNGLTGAFGVAAIDLYSGRTFLYNADTVFPTASTIKVPVLIGLFRLARAGELQLAAPITLQPGHAVGGSGHLQDSLKNGPVSLSLLELATKMIVDSDNTATNYIIDLVKMDRVNHLLQELGAKQTRLRRVMMDTAAAAKGNENVTTPLEMARLMESIYRDKAASPEDCAAILGILKQVSGAIRSTVPASIPVASKTGELTGVNCEIAIVFLEGRPFILSIYSSFLTPNENPLPAAAKLVFDHFLKLAKANSYGNQVR